MWHLLGHELDVDNVQSKLNSVSLPFYREFIHDSNLDKLRASFTITITDSYDVEGMEPFDLQLERKSSLESNYKILTGEDHDIFFNSLTKEYPNAFGFTSEQLVDIYLIAQNYFNKVA